MNNIRASISLVRSGRPLLDLQLPNHRTAWEQFQLRCCGGLFRGLVDFASLPLYYSPTYRKNRISTTINLGPTGSCRCLVYLPSKQLPKGKEGGVILHLHGGGWTICRPETEAQICRYLADELGCVVLAPDYAKAPRHPWPYALEQIYSLLDWCARGELNKLLETLCAGNVGEAPQVNSKLIAISGGSAGSNLAACVTLLAIERPLSNQAKIASIALLYPALNLAVAYHEKLARVDPKHVLPQWMSKFFLHSYLPPPRLANDPLISPMLAEDAQLSQFPPTAILSADRDYLAHEADEFAGKLERCGVFVRNRRFMNVGHGFDGIPVRDPIQKGHNVEATNLAWGMIRDIFRENILAEEVEQDVSDKGSTIA